MSLRIIGTGSSVPAKTVTNDELGSFLDTGDEWISSRTGIRSRRLCVDESMAELAERAARSALEQSELVVQSVDLILCSTMQGDHVTPSLACEVQQRLGAGCPAVDLNAACSGFIYALDMAEAYILSGKATRILIVCAEMMSKITDWRDRSTCVLFGDGAGACVVTAGSSLEYIGLTASGNTAPLCLDGRVGNSPFAEGRLHGEFLRMDGQEVFKFAVGTSTREIKHALDLLGLTPQSVDLYLLHQANKRIIDSVRTRLGLGQERFPTNIERYGNCSSASIPMLLDELVKGGVIKNGMRLVLSSFGAGMTSGTCVLSW